MLGVLIADAEKRAGLLGSRASLLRRHAAASPAPPAFGAALASGKSVAVIAELKRRSPSRGDINAALDLETRARAYVDGGAAALSVLTQTSHFGGTAADLADVAAVVDRPLLRKDFIVSPLQIVEARGLGASAVLLIARGLSPTLLRSLAVAAGDEGLETLIEVRDEAELERALESRANVVGVNNRNLETLAIDAAVSERLIPLIPPGVPAVYESGISDRSGVDHAARCGADAVLVGSSLSAAPEGVAAVRALVGVTRLGRGER